MEVLVQIIGECETTIENMNVREKRHSEVSRVQIT